MLRHCRNSPAADLVRRRLALAERPQPRDGRHLLEDGRPVQRGTHRRLLHLAPPRLLQPLVPGAHHPAQRRGLEQQPQPRVHRRRQLRHVVLQLRQQRGPQPALAGHVQQSLLRQPGHRQHERPRLRALHPGGGRQDSRSGLLHPRRRLLGHRRHLRPRTAADQQRRGQRPRRLAGRPLQAGTGRLHPRR